MMKIVYEKFSLPIQIELLFITFKLILSLQRRFPQLVTFYFRESTQNLDYIKFFLSNFILITKLFVVLTHKKYKRCI